MGIKLMVDENKELREAAAEFEKEMNDLWSSHPSPMAIRAIALLRFSPLLEKLDAQIKELQEGYSYRILKSTELQKQLDDSQEKIKKLETICNNWKFITDEFNKTIKNQYDCIIKLSKSMREIK